MARDTSSTSRDHATANFVRACGDARRQGDPRATSILSRLGLYGLDPIEPIVLAALATEEPLLLIGPHGTGKTLLLTRIAEALGLEWRHYNASLLNFDDLVGFPLPSPGGSLEYVRTPAAIWGAGAVIFDEISRCRPDIQNKLFPIVHERRAQGLLIDTLRYRWAAMNPPLVDDDDEQGYAGSEPLDPALADRFAFVVTMPHWSDLGERDQLAIIGATAADVDAAAGCLLRASIDATARTIPALQSALGGAAGEYTRTLVSLLSQAGLALSPRRAGMIARNVVAVHAARLAIDAGATVPDSAYLALQASIPQRAQGRPVQDAKLLAAHREAWRLAGAAAGDPLRALLTTADPLERFRLAVNAPSLAKADVSAIVADSLAQLPPGARDAAVVHLFETGAIGRLNAAVAEQAGARYAEIAQPLTFSESIHNTHPRFKTWTRIKELLGGMDPRRERVHLCANAIAASFARQELARPEDAEAALTAWYQADGRLSSRAPRGEEREGQS